MRLALVISSLSAGGAEKVLSTMANVWNQEGHEINLVTLDDSEPFCHLDAGIQRWPLGSFSNSRSIFEGALRSLQRIWKLRKTISRLSPDLVLSFIDKTNILTLFATISLGIPVIVSERTDPRHHDIGLIWKSLHRLTYQWADAIVANNREVADWLSHWAKGVHVEAIPNPIITPQARGDQTRLEFDLPPRPRMVAMGRLSTEKGFDLLLSAFSQTADRQQHWSLLILGDGPEQGNLLDQAVRLGIRDRVYLPGLVSDPIFVLRQCDLFILSSRFEGFPNALLEAMGSGLPVVSFDCPSGPREIIRHGVDGVLVPREDVDTMAEAMDRLMSNAAERERLSKRAVEVTKRFSVQKVIGMWNTLFGQIV